EVRLDAGGVAVHHEADGVVADQAVGHVGDVVGHRDVVGGPNPTVLVDPDLFAHMVQGVGEPLVQGLCVDRRGEPAGDRTVLVQGLHNPCTFGMSDRNQFVPHRPGQHDPVPSGVVFGAQVGDERV